MNNALWDYDSEYCPDCKRKGKIVKLEKTEKDKKCPKCLTVYFIIRRPEIDRELE